ncbi:MAG: arginine--tRNA ligase [Firmicutes bacterium]|nr:arginine--tRNA ligase [Bacillota bacterium]
MDYYNTPISRRREKIDCCIKQSLEKARAAGDIDFANLPAYVVETPREASHGDFASNVALLLSKEARQNPRALAKSIADHFDLAACDVASISIAGPGFINFHMAQGWQTSLLAEMLSYGEKYGTSDAGAGIKVQVEFVSANPTGELHMGNARGAAIGDSLASLLEMAGFDCAREYYINDAGNQIEKFGVSLEVLYLQALGQDIPFPEDGYHGADLPLLIKELVEEIGNEYQKLQPQLRQKKLIDYALKRKLNDIRMALADFGVVYDCWFSEQSLHDSGAIQNVIDELQNNGWLLKEEGALWMDCQRFGEEKPEVLVRGNGLPTYYAADIAYHKNKYMRGFATVIDVWGADHHGHVARMQGAMEALGYKREQLEVILMQFVRLIQNGELLKMSKRTGTYITLNELVEEVGRDAARFIFVMRSADSLIDFDLDLAKEQTLKNPVYYVQYAYARFCSIITSAAAIGLTLPTKPLISQQLQLLGHQSELALIRRLADFPDEVIMAALQREPHRIAAYVQEIAALFHNFYDKCRMLTSDHDLSLARLSLALVAATVIKNGLTALGVKAPSKM